MLHHKNPNCLCDYCTGNHSPLVRPGCPECGDPKCAKAMSHWMECSAVVRARNGAPKRHDERFYGRKIR